MKIVGIIPARYASSRFPGKPLAKIAGKSLIRRVVEQCRKATALSEVIVATDDQRIVDEAQDLCRVELTGSGHPSGTDRVAEVAARLPCDGVINIQGDEPLIEPFVIDTLARGLAAVEMVTAATPLVSQEDFRNPATPKVVVSRSGRALLFSRHAIPCVYGSDSTSPWREYPYLKHLGIYGYRLEALQKLVKLPISPLEKAERLEQLRALDNDFDITVFQVESRSVGVDLPEDIAQVETLIAKHS